MLSTQYFEFFGDEETDKYKQTEMTIHFVGLPGEYDPVLPTVDVTFGGEVHYNLAAEYEDYHEEENMGTDIDAAILRLERECAAIKSFLGQIRTKEQREVAEVLGLRHTGKRIAISEDIDCHGMFYSKDSELCNLHCGRMKECIHDMNEFRRKVERVFPQMHRTIFKLMRELVEGSEA